MPSLNIVSGLAEHWIEQHKRALQAYSEKIQICIDQSDWDELSDVLESRQGYLEQLFGEAAWEQHRGELKQLAQTILDQDAAFLAHVELQKNTALQQQLSFERGRRAIEAYNGQ